MNLTPPGDIAAALLVVALVATACTPSGSESPGGEASAKAPSSARVDELSVAPSATEPERLFRDPQGKVVEFPTVDVASATPARLRTVTTVEAAPAVGDHQLPHALGKGKTLMTVSPTENYVAPQFVKHDRIGLLSDDGKVQLFADTSKIRPDGLPRQIYTGDMDDRRAVWMETSSTDLYQSNWRLFARELAGGEPRLLAAAEDQLSVSDGPLPLTEGDPMPRLSGGLVWWWSTTEREDGTFYSRVLAVDPAGGEPKEMLSPAGEVVPVDGGVVAVQLRKADEPGAEREYLDTGLVMVDAAGSVRDLLRYSPSWEDHWFVEALDGSGDIVAVAMGGAVWIIRTDGTPAAHIPLQSGQSVSDLAVCSHKVAFSPQKAMGESGGKVMIYDTDKQALTSFDASDLEPDIRCSQDRLMWAQIPDEWKIYTIAEW